MDNNTAGANGLDRQKWAASWTQIVSRSQLARSPTCVVQKSEAQWEQFAAHEASKLGRKTIDVLKAELCFPNLLFFRDLVSHSCN